MQCFDIPDSLIRWLQTPQIVHEKRLSIYRINAVTARREIPRSSSLPELLIGGMQLFLLTALMLPFHLLDRASVFDDAYIHLRIARNLAILGAPFFNIDDPVIATSAPLWTLLLALLYSLPFEPRILVGAGNAVASALAALTWTGLLRDLAPSTARLSRLTASLGILGLLSIASAGLMETPLAMFFAAFGLRAALRGSVLSGTWIVFGAFLRPEVAVFIFPVMLFVQQRSWKRLCAAELCAALVAGAGLLLMQSLFGGIIPHTIGAKRVVYQGSPEIVLVSLIQLLCGEALPINKTEVTFAYATGAILLALAALFLWRKPSPNDHDRPLDAFWVLVAAVAIAGAYIAGGALIFPWYAPLITLPLFVGTLGLIRSTPGIVRGAILLWLCMPGIWIMTREYLAIFKSPRWAPLVLSNSRVEQIMRIGKVLDTYIPDARIAAPEIGALGYTFEGTILDGVGLATGSALQFHPLPWPAERVSSLVGAVPGPFIELEHPDVVVGLHDFISTSARRVLMESYTRTEVPIYSRVTTRALQNSDYESNDLWDRQLIDIFIRNDFTVPRSMIDELESIR